MNTNRINYSEYTRLPNKNIKHIPGDSGLPIIGDTLRFLRDFPGLAQEKYQKYGPVFREYAFFQHTIVLLGPEANEAVLNDPERNFSNSLAWNPTLEKIFPNGLMLRDFDEHKYHRKILQAAFKKPAIESYLRLMAPHIAHGIEDWPQQEVFSFCEHIKKLLLGVAAEVFLGLDISDDAKELNQSFVDTVDASLAIIRIPIPGNTWWRGQKGRKYLENFVRKHIPEKRESESNDIFSQICHAVDDEGNSFGDQAIVDHLIFLLFAAHDTTTSTLCSIIYSLAKNPQWQRTLRKEILAIDSQTTALKTLDYEDLATMEKTSLVFKEALRMYPALPTIPRRCIRETTVLGHRIPKNAGVGISPLFTHYMEEYWSNPYQFDPERFSKERAEDKKHFFQFVPFGGGAHKCLGLNFAEIQVKIFLFNFLKKYEVSVKENYEMQYSVVPISFPTDGLPVTITALESL